MPVDEEGGAVVIDLVRSGDRDQEERAFDLEVKELIDIGVRGLKEEFREVFLLRESRRAFVEEMRGHGVAARHGKEPPEIRIQGAPAGVHGVGVFRGKTESERGVKG